MALILATGVCATEQIADRVLRVGHPTAAVSQAYPFGRDEGGGIRAAIYDGLTYIDSKGDLRGALAVDWEKSDAFTWTFQLRQGVHFSNGQPFTAASVEATLDELFDSKAYHPRAADVDTIKSFRATGEYSFTITTVKPDPLLPRRISLIPIIEPLAWYEKGKALYSKKPVGTGPYNIETWGPNNTRPVLVGTPSSWRPISHFNRIEIKVLPDPSSRIAGLISKELDFAVGVGSDDLEYLQGLGYKTRILGSPNILSIALRTVRNNPSPISDVKVRQAMNYAVDKKSIVEHILSGTSRVAHQPAVEGLAGYNPNLKKYNYDPDKARELLKNSKYSGGFTLKLAVYGGLLAGDTLIFQKVAQDLGAVGIQIELRQISFPEYVRRLFNADWEGIDGFSLGWMNSTLWDPQKAYEQFSCKYTAPFFCDESMMPLINAARIEMDHRVRQEMLQQLTRKFVDQAVALFLIEFSGTVAYDSRIKIDQFRLDGSAFENISVN